jgi:hypothetical protein
MNRRWKSIISPPMLSSLFQPGGDWSFHAIAGLCKAFLQNGTFWYENSVLQKVHTSSSTSSVVKNGTTDTAVPFLNLIFVTLNFERTNPLNAYDRPRTHASPESQKMTPREGGQGAENLRKKSRHVRERVRTPTDGYGRPRTPTDTLFPEISASSIPASASDRSPHLLPNPQSAIRNPQSEIENPTSTPKIQASPRQSNLLQHAFFTRIVHSRSKPNRICTSRPEGRC